MQLEFKHIDPSAIVAKYGCPFCLLQAYPDRSELEAHVATCAMYHALDDTLPTSPASAIVIDPDHNYTLETYLEDEMLYFECMKSIATAPAPAVTSLPDIQAYFDHEITTHTNTPLTASRMKNLNWRLVSTFYVLPDELLQHMMSKINTLDTKM